MPSISRRTFLTTSGAVATSAAAAVAADAARATPARPVPVAAVDGRRGGGAFPRLRFATKLGMFRSDAPLVERFKALKEIGFDGVELDSPNQLDRDDVLRARDASGLRIHGVVDSIHWRVRLSDPDAKVREEGRAGLETAIRDASAYGGSSVLLVPGRVTKNATQEQVWERSIEQVRAVLPLAADLGIHVLIENVWNGFCYVHDGPSDQTADQLADYIDAFASPWVGSYFDIGNHRKYGEPEAWMRRLGPRIVKLDVKDWGVEAGFAKIGDGDVDWAEVRKAIDAIGFTGWCTAEVRGGGIDRMREIKARMDEHVRG